MNNDNDLIGKKFGKLIIIERCNKKPGRVYFNCLCDCGKKATVEKYALVHGITKSCGCQRAISSHNTHFNDLSGNKFGKLTVLERANNVDKRTIWKCECECGNIVFVESYSLKNGNTKSCGCLKYDSRNYTHKHSSERIYKIWLSMKARCFYKTNHAYKWYGAIGIRVCDEWKNDFMSFYNWSMENGYSEHLSIDRIDVNGNYEPNNCRWTTMEVQQNNRRNTTYIEYNGMKKTISEWSKITGIKRSTLYNRIKIGYTPEECFNVKLCSRRGRKRENM